MSRSLQEPLPAVAGGKVERSHFEVAGLEFSAPAWEAENSWEERKKFLYFPTANQINQKPSSPFPDTSLGPLWRDDT